jgi:hypothetical protein
MTASLLLVSRSGSRGGSVVKSLGGAIARTRAGGSLSVAAYGDCR